MSVLWSLSMQKCLLIKRLLIVGIGVGVARFAKRKADNFSKRAATI